MELQKAFEKRRSIRKYKDKDVTKEQILELLESARMSPSARNIQPWRFYISRGEEKNKIAKIMKDYHKNNPENTIGMHSTALAIEQAPVLILVFRDSETPLDRNDTLSMGASIEHILLKATEINLGSLWICAMYKVRKEIAELVGVNLELYSMIAIGHADETPEARPRKKLEEIILN